MGNSGVIASEPIPERLIAQKRQVEVRLHRISRYLVGCQVAKRKKAPRRGPSPRRFLFAVLSRDPIQVRASYRA